MRPLLVVERFEGDHAVLDCAWLDGSKSMERLPRKLLYPWTKEGDVLTIVVTTNEAETAWRRAQAAAATPTEGG